MAWSAKASARRTSPPEVWRPPVTLARSVIEAIALAVVSALAILVLGLPIVLIVRVVAFAVSWAWPAP